jgi:NDP-sugar pyrophosphorylase family protein
MGHLSESAAVILAGGLGTRLRPVAADRPKVLAEVQGRPFLVYLLDQLESFGVQAIWAVR